MGELIGVKEIAEMAGVTSAAVANWQKRYPSEFPLPVEKVDSGPVFDSDEVVEWLERRKKPIKPLGFEDVLWKAADKLRGSMDASEYKHVVLGLIFLKYVEDAFEERRAALRDELAQEGLNADDARELLESRDEYTAEGVFWIPPKARWQYLKERAKQPEIGKLIDTAMDLIEADNPSLRGVLPKTYARPSLDVRRLGELVDLISGIGLGSAEHREEDVLGRVYEYFLGRFASAEGKGGGEFYTPRSVVKLLVEMIEPLRGRVYDGCCGSGGMFVQAERFVDAHGGRRNDIAVYGQELNDTTWRLAKMNLAIRGIEADLGPRWGDTFHEDLHSDLKADYILANPPFNVSDWGGDQLREDPRWLCGVPPVANANYAWLQHFASKLSPRGVAGIVLANGSLSSQQSGEGDIRRRLIERDLVDCIVALPGQLFYSTQIPVSLWFINRDKRGSAQGWRDRQGEILFVDARKLGTMVDRTHRELADTDIARIAGVYHAWRGEPDAGPYEDMPGFCKSAAISEIEAQRYVLNPGRYAGGGVADHDDESPADRASRLSSSLFDATDRAWSLEADFRTARQRLALSENGEATGQPWEMRPLSSLARFVNGGAFTKGASGTGRLVIRIAELTGGPGPSTVYNDIQVGEDHLAQPGDLLFAWSGSLVVTRWRYDEAIINQHIFKVIPNPGMPLWFVHGHILRLLPEFRQIAADKATTMGHIQRHHLDVEVPMPPRDYLGQLDEICRPLWDWALEQERVVLTLRELHDTALPSLAGGTLVAAPRQAG